ncbi:transposase family protein [Streptomyces sp. NPDC050549]|uniref:transposase family protein n=1 Tax=Streptomyces sp. NPDC050549 TaxID=3155406 RepID=UPI00343C1087
MIVCSCATCPRIGTERPLGLRTRSREKGRLIWISVARPGRNREATAARHGHLVENLKAAGSGALADLGFLGVDKPDDPDDPVVVTCFKAARYRKLTAGQKEANRVLVAGRVPVKHGFAHLKNWRILTKLRADPARATGLLRAPLVLTNLEVNR